MGNPGKRKQLRKLEAVRRSVMGEATVADETPSVKEVVEEVEQAVEQVEEAPVKTSKKKKALQTESDAV
jgi:hypothetical protein